MKKDDIVKIKINANGIIPGVGPVIFGETVELKRSIAHGLLIGGVGTIVEKQQPKKAQKAEREVTSEVTIES